MRYYKSILTAFVLIVSLTSLTWGITLEEAVKQWKDNYEILVSPEISYDVNFAHRTIRAYYPDEPNKTPNIPKMDAERRVFHYGKLMFDIHVISPDGTSGEIHTTFNGTEYKSLDKANKLGFIDNAIPKGGNVPIQEHTVFHYFGCTHINRFTRDANSPGWQLTTLEPKKISDVNCIGFRLNHTVFSDAVQELWLAPEKNMLMIKYYDRWTNNTGGADYETLEIGENNGFYYPKYAKSNLTGVAKMVIEKELLIYNFEINPKIDPGIFELVFPNGTQVVDQRTGQCYIIDLTSNL